jgi:hypothetical protein
MSAIDSFHRFFAKQGDHASSFGMYFSGVVGSNVHNESSLHWEFKRFKRDLL